MPSHLSHLRYRRSLHRAPLSFALLCFLALFIHGPAAAASYEANLPPQLFSAPDMCTHVDCKAVLPQADSFSPRKGQPPYVEGYRTTGGEKKPVGYVFLSTDIVDIPAYSGKPVITLIGMDTKGIITGIRILKHSEPILLVGIPEIKLTQFIDQYVGKPANSRFEIGKLSDAGDYVSLDAISGATVTVIAENQVISRCAFEVARQAGIVRVEAKPAAHFTGVAEISGWDDLISEGSVQRLTVKPSEVGESNTGMPYIDMYFGYLNVPAVGRSVLGDEAYRRLMGDLKPDEHAFFIVSNGTASFKGSGFVRGGIYDRIQIKQDRGAFSFRDTDYQNLYALKAAGAPEYRESGIFILRNTAFSAAYPWQLAFLANKMDKDTGARTFANFEREYWVADRYLDGGRPKVERPEAAWMKVWRFKKFEGALFVAWLIGAALFYATRDRWVRLAKRTDKRWVLWPKIGFWLFGVGFVGYYEMAQPSVTQIMTWFHALLSEWKWELFLSDPFIFTFWWFLIITLFFWGRGLFCGWLCPYGALSELTFKLGGKIGLARFQFKLPKPLHDRLKWLKYAIFIVLLLISFGSMELAERLAEVEPFKTTFLVGVWNRSWPFVTYWSMLFVLGFFMERPYCKYICPLGAGLAIPTTLRFFGLKRKPACTTCHACQTGCGSQAIDDAGKIDHRECLLCLDCMVMYYDDHACPPLAQERRRREKAGLPLTPIAGDGHFIPLKEIRG